MNDHDAAQDELIELATALSDGDFTPAQAARLRELLTAHGDLLTVYVRILLLQSLLGQEVEGLRQGMTEAESGAWRLVASAGDDVHASRDDPEHDCAGGTITVEAPPGRWQACSDPHRANNGLGSPAGDGRWPRRLPSC